MPSMSEKSITAMRNALSIYNLGISPEVAANMTVVANAISNAMKDIDRMDLSGVYEFASQFSEISRKLQPATENARQLATLIMEELKTNVEPEKESADLVKKSAKKSANSDKELVKKSANSDKKTAKKSADKSADNLKDFNLRQKQILSIMEYGREYTTENIATLIGLKNPRTRQLMNELVELEIIESLGTTKNRRYRKR